MGIDCQIIAQDKNKLHCCELFNKTTQSTFNRIFKLHVQHFKNVMMRFSVIIVVYFHLNGD